MKEQRRVEQRIAAGFTLVELLVVVAIIAILMALLLPSLKAARNQAKTVKCAANMRSIVQAINMFAQEREGRGVGGGCRVSMGSTPTVASTNWAAVLNAEIFKVPTFWPAPNQHFVWVQNGGVPLSGGLTCPVQMDADPGFAYQTTYYYSRDADGGPNWGPTYPEWGTYGVPQDPATVNYLYQASGSGWTLGPDTTAVNPLYGYADPSMTTGYWWGAKLYKFNSAYQIILTEAANAGHGGSQPVSPMTLDPNKFTYSDGVISFRHPFGKGANFAFFDGHVERMGPLDTWNRNDRLFMP